MRKAFVALVIIALCTGVAAWLLASRHYETVVDELVGRLTPDTPGKCLASNEKALFEILEKTEHSPRYEINADGSWGKLVAGHPGKVRISVIDTTSSTTLWSRELEHPTTGNYINHQLGRCAFYIPQAFNVNYSRTKVTEPSLAGYLFQLWKFDYFSDSGKPIVTIAENPDGTREGYKSNYSTAFSIDPSEKFVSLIRFDSQYNEDLVIRDIQTGRDVYVLTSAELYRTYPTLQGTFQDMGHWAEHSDGVYFVGYLAAAAIFDGLYDIKRDSWETNIYVTTPDFNEYSAGESAIAPSFPYMAYTTMYSGNWFEEESEEERYQIQLRESAEKVLKFADLRTGATTTIETVPVIKGHEYNPTWLTDTELQYTMPDGTTRTYTVQ